MTEATADKERVMLYLDPELSLLLRLERAETRKPVTQIVEDIIRNHYKSQPRTKRRATASA